MSHKPLSYSPLFLLGPSDPLNHSLTDKWRELIVENASKKGGNQAKQGSTMCCHSPGFSVYQQFIRARFRGSAAVLGLRLPNERPKGGRCVEDIVKRALADIESISRIVKDCNKGDYFCVSNQVLCDRNACNPYRATPQIRPEFGSLVRFSSDPSLKKPTG